MAYRIELREAAPQLFAAVRDTATLETLAKKITSSGVWDYLRKNGIRSGGYNIVVYHDTGRRDFEVEIGADVLAPFAGGEGVICSSTPGGIAASTLHIGPYSRLGEAHAAVAAWCRHQGHRPTGVRWEIYGHWNEDPTKLETELFHLLGRPEG